MSQHDYSIANASGSAVRSDLNNALGAIATANSGATAPTTTYAYMLWADTANTKLKMRNGANSAWIEVGTLDSANLGLMLASYFPNVNSNITASDEELNKLDGCNATTTELNLLSGKTSLVSLSDVYPVGSIYINATNNSNPSSYFGFGTWVAFGAGKVLVGVDTGDSDFDTVEETGGSKTHTLTTAEIPAHTHNYDKANSNAAFVDGSDTRFQGTTSTATSSTGGGGAHNNLQPYITVYMWKRTE